MGVLVIRSKIKPENVTEVETAARKMFNAIEEAQPQGIRYLSSKSADGQTYVAVLEVKDGIDNPLQSLPAVKEFQENLQNWLAEPPAIEQLSVVGSYSS